VWKFFGEKIIPVIRDWQLERTISDPENHKDVINNAIMKILDHLESEKKTKAQVRPSLINRFVCAVLILAGA
jgi:hypothetical protein